MTLNTTLIVSTRQTQCNRNSEYQEYRDTLGWQIVHKDAESKSFKEPPDAKYKRAYIRSVFEKPFNVPWVGDTFSAINSAIVKANLVVDKVPIQMVRDQKGYVRQLLFMDPRYIKPIMETVWLYKNREQKQNTAITREEVMRILDGESNRYKANLRGTHLADCLWIQYVQNEITAGFKQDELIVGINNPDPRIDRFG